MKAQTIFNKVWKHFIVNKGKRSIEPSGDGGTCLYRGGEGKKCAVGVLIPNDLYQEDMEMHGVEDVFKLFPHIKEYLGIENLHFLIELQEEHDNGENWNFKGHIEKNALVKIAEDYGLEIPL